MTQTQSTWCFFVSLYFFVQFHTFRIGLLYLHNVVLAINKRIIYNDSVAAYFGVHKGVCKENTLAENCDVRNTEE